MTDNPWEYTVGDINSLARGSGARANGGKMRLEYVPVGLWQDIGIVPKGWEDFVSQLASFQNGDNAAIFRSLPYCQHYIYAACDVFDYGAQKYAAWNWAKGMPWSVPIACIGRHLRAMAQGEQYDKESGKLHEGHILCNVLMLCTYVEYYPEGDDRPVGSCFYTHKENNKNEIQRSDDGAPVFADTEVGSGCFTSSYVESTFHPWPGCGDSAKQA